MRWEQVEVVEIEYSGQSIAVLAEAARVEETYSAGRIDGAEKLVALIRVPPEYSDAWRAARCEGMPIGPATGDPQDAGATWTRAAATRDRAGVVVFWHRAGGER